jgi:dipeptidyl aminopeptidase/acylaminoacyl peptidase
MFKQGYGAGAARIIESGAHNTVDMLVDAGGHPIAREDYDTESGLWTLSVKPASGWRNLRSVTAKLDPPSLRGFGPNERSLIVFQHEDDGDHYREVAIDSGTWSAPIPALDETSLIIDHRKRVVLGGVDAGHMKLRYAFLDPSDQQLWARAERAFPGETVKLESWSDDHAKLVLHVTGQKSGNSFYLLDLAAKRADPIADEYAGIAASDLNEVRTISYTAQDGLSIPAYLTLPHGPPAKSLPLVVLVHGGPASHDEPGFDWWSQALASLGYAVLQPQYRGSAGFGRSFMEAGYGQWGGKMQTDLSDGVNSLAKQGIVDPHRVCIAGSDFGGYAALAGVTLQSGIYRCAVAVAAVSDLRLMLRAVQSHTRTSRSLSMRYWQRFMGAKSSGDDTLDAISPAKHADRLSAPLLLIHGQVDAVVDPEQSRAMLAAAERAGKSVRLITLKGEDHSLARGATRLEMLQATADFLRANLPVEPGTIAAR